MPHPSPHPRLFAARAFFILPLALVLMCGVVVSGPVSAQSCHEEALEAERANGLPNGLLVAMALVESGRSGEPQAYAVNTGGRAVYARSPEEAARLFRDKSGRPKGNTFVGCLQLSVRYHHRGFRHLRGMVDPAQNTAYAAKYLKRHYQEYGNWTKALMRYNGGGQKQRRAYVCKIWNALRHLDRASASLLDSGSCRSRTIAVAPSTRRAVRDAQLAEHQE